MPKMQTQADWYIGHKTALARRTLPLLALQCFGATGISKQHKTPYPIRRSLSLQWNVQQKKPLPTVHQELCHRSLPRLRILAVHILNKDFTVHKNHFV